MMALREDQWWRRRKPLLDEEAELPLVGGTANRDQVVRFLGIDEQNREVLRTCPGPVDPTDRKVVQARVPLPTRTALG
jgi:hypothetical protein